MEKQHKNTPLHGVKLEEIVTQLHEAYGWDGLAERVNINCFKKDPSVKSSLKFLRKQLWAREQVEKLYISHVRKNQKPQEGASNEDPWANFKK